MSPELYQFKHPAFNATQNSSNVGLPQKFEDAGIMSRALCRLRGLIAAPSSLAGISRASPTASSVSVFTLMLCGVFLIGAIVLTIGFILSHLRDRAIAENEQQLLATATLLAKQEDRDLQALDLVELGLIERMQALGIVSDDLYEHTMAGHDVHLLLGEKLGAFPHIAAVMMVGADGKLINSSQSWPVPARNVGDQDYFGILKSSPELSSAVSEPMLDHDSGVWTIYLAHIFIGSNGEFLGLVVGAIRSEYFEEFYQTIVRGPSESIALFRRDAVMLARYPHVDSFMGKSFAGKTFRIEGLSHHRGVSRQMSAIDGQDRLIAGVRIANSPTYVVVTTTIAATLANWGMNAHYLIGLTVLPILAIGGIGAFVVQHFRGQSVQLDAASNNISQGLCMYDAAQRLIVIVAST